MESVITYPFEPKYKRENGLAVFDLETLPLPADFSVQETSAIRIPAGQVAGNHKHTRQEAYACLDEGAELHWIDDTGKTHVAPMTNRLFFMPPNVPHAVVNTSDREVTLIGVADGPLENVKEVVVARPQTTTGASPSEDAVAAELSRLKPGYLPKPIFLEVTRLVVMPIVEVVPLRRHADKVEILLTQRAADDPFWPRQWHVPGTVVRATDAPGSFADPLQRVLQQELKGVATAGPEFVKTVFHHSGRGMEMSQIFWVEVTGEPNVGEFYDADNLPPTVVTSQLDFIPDAVAHFKKTKGVKS